MAEDRTVGWFVEIPRSLRDEFDRLYPGKRNKKILTITAIQRAVRLAPKSLFNLYRESPVDVEATKDDVSRGSSDSSGGEEEFEDSGERERESPASHGRYRSVRSGEDREAS